MIFRTPKTIWPLALIAGILTLAEPIVVPMYFNGQFTAGAYRNWQGDAIGIPIFMYWLFYFPVSLLLLVRGLYRYAGATPIWTWDGKRILRSIGWTFAFLWTGLADWGLIEHVNNVPPQHPEVAAFFGMHIYGMALLQAAIINNGRRLETNTNIQPTGPNMTTAELPADAVASGELQKP